MHDPRAYVGKIAELHVSDPWEFEDENPSPKIRGTVEVADATGLLLRADNAVSIGETQFQLLVCRVRHEGASMSDATTSAGVACNGTGIPGNREDAARKLDVSWWRGGGAVIGSLRIL